MSMSSRSKSDAVPRTTWLSPVMGVALACLLSFPAAISLGETTFHVSVDGRDDHPGTEDQAHAGQQNAAITVFGLRDSSFERCEIAHVGFHAIRLDEGCQHNVVRNNIFAFCGDSGFNRLFKAHAKDYEYDQSTLERNIVYQSEGDMTSGYYAPRWTKDRTQSLLEHARRRHCPLQRLVVSDSQGPAQGRRHFVQPVAGTWP
jgi:hypothetical protein